MKSRMGCNILDWHVLIVLGLMALVEVSCRTTPLSNMSNPETTNSLPTPSSTSVDISEPNTPPPTADAPALATNSAGPSQCPPVPDIADELCMMQVKQTSFPCDQDSDCFLPNHICCPHYCNQKICKDLNGASSTRSMEKPKTKPQNVPKNIKHPDNVPTIEHLVDNFKVVDNKISATATLSSASTSSASAIEPSPVTIVSASAIEHSPVTIVSASAIEHSPVTIVSASAIEHSPVTIVSASVIEPSSSSISTTSLLESSTPSLSSVSSAESSATYTPNETLPPSVSGVITSLQPSVTDTPTTSVPSSVFITEANANLSPSVSIVATPSLVESLKNTVIIESGSYEITASDEQAIKNQISIKMVTPTAAKMQPSMTGSGESSVISAQLSSTTSVQSTSTEDMTATATITTSVTPVSTEAVTVSSEAKQECPTLACSTTCRYGTKVDAFGCPVCDCMFNDKCPPVLPIPRILCTLKLRTTSFTCDMDSDCLQGHICCPGACAGNVCRRVFRETFRTLTITSSG